MNYADPYGLNPVAAAVVGGSIGGPVGAVIGAGIGIIGGQILWDKVIKPWLNNDKLPTPPSDPSQSPGEGWEWRGKDPPGGKRGGWYNPGTGERLHPDLDHPAPIRSPLGLY